MNEIVIPFLGHLDATTVATSESKNIYFHTASPFGDQVVLTDQIYPSLTYVNGVKDKSFTYSPYHDEFNPLGNCHYGLTLTPLNYGELYGKTLLQIGMARNNKRGGFSPMKTTDYTETFLTDNGTIDVETIKYYGDFSTLTAYDEILNGVTDNRVKNISVKNNVDVYRENGMIEEISIAYDVETFADSMPNILDCVAIQRIRFDANITKNFDDEDNPLPDTLVYKVNGAPKLLSMVDASNMLTRSDALAEAKSRNPTAHDQGSNTITYFDGVTEHKLPSIIWIVTSAGTVNPTITDYKNNSRYHVVNNEDMNCIGDNVGVVYDGVSILNALVILHDNGASLKDIPIANISAWNKIKDKCDYGGTIRTFAINKFPIATRTISRARYEDTTSMASGFTTMSFDAETMTDKTPSPYLDNHQYTFNTPDGIVYYTNWARIVRVGARDQIYKTRIGSGDIMDMINYEHSVSGFYPFDNFNYDVDRIMGLDPSKYGKPYITRRSLERIIDPQNMNDDTIYLLGDYEVTTEDYTYTTTPVLKNIVTAHANSVYTLLLGSGDFYLVLRDGSGYYRVATGFDPWIGFIDDEEILIGEMPLSFDKTNFYKVELTVPLPSPRQLVYDFKFARYAFIGCQTRYMAKGGIISKV